MIYSLYIIAPFAAYLVAHLIKFTIRALEGDVNFRYFYLSGGMPSAHAATVTSLVVVAAMVDGINSAVFGITAVFATIVIYDSFGVRRAAGNQGLVLSKLMQLLAKDNEDEELLKMHLQPVLGHSPSEVAAGLVTGGGLGLVFTAHIWAANLGFLTALPLELERFILLGLFTVLTVGAIAIRIVMGRSKRRNLPSYKALRNLLWGGTFSFGLVGLFFMLVAFEGITFWGYRLWPYATLAFLIIYLALYWLRWRPRLLPKVAAEEQARALRRQKSRQKRKKSRKKRRR